MIVSTQSKTLQASRVGCVFSLSCQGDEEVVTRSGEEEDRRDRCVVGDKSLHQAVSAAQSPLGHRNIWKELSMGLGTVTSVMKNEFSVPLYKHKLT